MKKLLPLILVIFIVSGINAQPPAGDAKPGDSYGEKFDNKGAITLGELNTKLKKSESYTGKVVGVVREVCANKGCWLTMELPDKTKMQVKFKDYGFFVPAAIFGKTVVLNGEARQKIVSVNELKHYAEDAKKSRQEVEAITKPEKQIKFMADGVLVIK